MEKFSTYSSYLNWFQRFPFDSPLTEDEFYRSVRYDTSFAKSNDTDDSEENVNANDVFYYHVLQRIQSANESLENDDFQEWMEFVEPVELFNATVQGVVDLVDYCEEFISEDTVNIAKSSLEEVEIICDTMQTVWQQIKDCEENNNYSYVMDQMFSDEAKLGAAIGSVIMPGIGTAVGAFMGAISNTRQVDDLKEKSVKQFDNLYESFLNLVDDIWVERIYPSLVDDAQQSD
jgi:hypothetical protein